MNVLNYYTEGHSIFQGTDTTLLTDKELNMMDELFEKYYMYRNMFLEDPLSVSSIVAQTLLKNNLYYSSIIQSYNIEFDPLVTTDFSKDVAGISESSRAGKAYDYKAEGELTEGESLRLNTNDQVNTLVDDRLDYDSREDGKDGKIKVENVNKPELSDKTVDSKNTTITSYGRNDNIKDYTSKNTSAGKRPTYDKPETLTTTDETETKLDNNEKVTVETKTRDFIKTTDTSTTTFGEESKPYSETTSGEATSQATNRNSIESSNSDKNIHALSRNNNSSSTNINEDMEKVIDNVTKRVKGYQNADFKSLVESVYMTKKINIYDIIMKDISEEILMNTYSFE